SISSRTAAARRSRRRIASARSSAPLSPRRFPGEKLVRSLTQGSSRSRPCRAGWRKSATCGNPSWGRGQTSSSVWRGFRSCRRSTVLSPFRSRKRERRSGSRMVTPDAPVAILLHCQVASPPLGQLFLCSPAPSRVKCRTRSVNNSRTLTDRIRRNSATQFWRPSHDDAAGEKIVAVGGGGVDGAGAGPCAGAAEGGRRQRGRQERRRQGERDRQGPEAAGAPARGEADVSEAEGGHGR